jgi:hypothetical protein
MYDFESIAQNLLTVIAESPLIFGGEERSMNPSLFTKFRSSTKQSALCSIR